MLDYKTDLFILKDIDYKDLDRLVTVYTKDFGKKVVKLRSAYKPLSKLNSHIQFFSIISCDIISGKTFEYIGNANKDFFYNNISSKLKKNTIYYFILELLDKIIEHSVKDVELYNFCIRYFNCLENIEIKDDDIYVSFSKDKELIDSLYKFVIIFFKMNGFNIKKEYLNKNILDNKENFFNFIYFYVEKYLKIEKFFIN